MVRPPAALAVLLATSIAPVAEAQDEVAASRFDAHRLFVSAFDGDLRDTLRLVRPGRMTQWSWFVGAVGEYAHAPLVRYDVVGADGARLRTNLLDHVVALNLSGGVTFHERFRLDVAAPVFFASFGADDQYQGVQFGDIRLTGTVAALIPDASEEGLGLAVVGRLDVPSGNETVFLGETGVAGGGAVTFSYATGGLTVTAEAGVHFRPAYQLDNLTGADSFVGGVGIGYLVHETTALTLEGLFEAAFEQNRAPLTSSPMELTLSLRHRRPNGGHLLAGASVGLTQGVGAPRARAFLGGGFGAFEAPAPRDRDGDGLPDTSDKCPEVAEVRNAWMDEDGCPDGLGNLAIRVLLEGRPVVGAEVDLLGSDEEAERFESGNEARVLRDLPPGTTFDAVARFGGCLAGDGSVTVREGENLLEVVLQPVRSGMVRYEIVNPSGTPVPGAAAAWRTSDVGCADREGYAVGQTGVFQHPIGIGEHTVFIVADAYRVARRDVLIEPGETTVVRVEMQPTKVSVGKKEIRILEQVLFETGSAVIQKASHTLLDEVADTLIMNDLGRVLIEGHTDDRGDDRANLRLSEARAQAVRDYLIGKGIPDDMLLAQGFGETKPIASNANEAGRARNRRVVFTLLDAPAEEK